MERRRLRIADQIRDLADGERRFLQILSGRGLARIVEEGVIGGALGRQPPLQCAAGHRQCPGEGADAGIAARDPRGQRAWHL